MASPTGAIVFSTSVPETELTARYHISNGGLASWYAIHQYIFASAALLKRISPQIAVVVCSAPQRSTRLVVCSPVPVTVY